MTLRAAEEASSIVDEALSMVVVPGMLRRRPTRSEGDSKMREKYFTFVTLPFFMHYLAKYIQSIVIRGINYAIRKHFTIRKR